MANQGWNPIHGADVGPPPPGTGCNRPPVHAPVVQYPIPQHPVIYQQPAYQYPQGQVMYQYPCGFVNPAMPQQLPPQPQAAGPPTNNGMPGIHFTNPSGGIGLPPGYDYLFPTEHCTIHCIKSTIPPWQTSNTIFSWDPSKFNKVMVPVNTTVAEMMTRLGCTNKDAKKNAVHEVVEKGNGGWSKGLTITGDNKDRCKKAIKDFGWDESRTGFSGEKQVVWLWLTKD